MKIPSFHSVLLACVAAFAGDAQPKQAYVNRPLFRPAAKRIKPLKLATDRFRSNQRQKRKDARRAHANGHKKAFC